MLDVFQKHPLPHHGMTIIPGMGPPQSPEGGHGRCQ
jgi:hypothetical protein